MKIISCGCSFMTVDQANPGTHFSEILAAHFNADIECYAKMGSSNFTVRLQIEEAIKQQPDLILIGFTSPDRIELMDKPYQHNRGIKNISYTKYNPNGTHILPSFYNEETVTTDSNSIGNFPQTPELKNWLTGMYDIELKMHQDYFFATGSLDRLQKHNIPFVFTEGGLAGMNWTEWDAHNTKSNPWDFVNHTSSPGSGVYHTTFDVQKELAGHWINHLINGKFLTVSC